MNTTARAAATDGDERSMLPDGGGGGKVPRKENAWLAHVKAYREVHPGLSYKEVLEKAGETYKKVVKKPKVADGDKKPNPWMMHIARWKEAHPNWKETYAYKDVLLLCKDTYSPSKKLI
jgi:hypothetical protein